MKKTDKKAINFSFLICFTFLLLFHRSESEDSDLDLSKEMYPISHYVNDREEMINQVFNVIKGKKLRSMLPPFLAEMDVDEVKALCLEQVIKSI